MRAATGQPVRTRTMAAPCKRDPHEQFASAVQNPAVDEDVGDSQMRGRNSVGEGRGVCSTLAKEEIEGHRARQKATHCSPTPSGV